MNNLFDKKESWGKRKRKNQQDKALVEMVKLGYEKSARVKKMLDDAGIDSAAIKSREDLEKLPVTSREKLVDMEQQHPP
ncbi:MAG: phenylacetate--CoA ligase, partial [Candidatus Moranbacteria bacterium]|nr:phenylacetate--CoA ligase [Candidatus Moranbacteria bacterium]